MMYDTDFEVFDVICNIPENRYAHDEQIELYIFDLVVEFFDRCPLENRLYLDFFLLFFSQLLFLCFLFPLLLPILHGGTHLFGDLFIAVVYNLNEKVAAFINCSPMEHEDLENIADDTFVVDGQIHFHGVHLAG